MKGLLGRAFGYAVLVGVLGTIMAVMWIARQMNRLTHKRKRGGASNGS